MASTARRYIYAGLGLLLAALVLSLVSMYSATWSQGVRATLSVPPDGKQVVIAGLLASHGLPVDEVINITMKLTCLSCPGGIEVILPRHGAVSLSTGMSYEASLTPLSALYIRPLDSYTCKVALEIDAAGRRYPYKLLGLAALALMIAGTAALSLGALLRMSGLEEDNF